MSSTVVLGAAKVVAVNGRLALPLPLLLVCPVAVTRPEARVGISPRGDAEATADDRHGLAVCVLVADHRPRHGAVAACRPAKPYRTSHFVGWARRDVQVQLKNRGYIRARISPPEGGRRCRPASLRPPVSQALL